MVESAALTKTKEALTEFARQKVQNPWIQKVKLQDANNKAPLEYEAYAVFFSSEDVANYLRANLPTLAKHGLIAAIDGQTYRNLITTSRTGARKLIKDFTRHNDKLGYDFDVLSRRYTVNYSAHFSSSAYPDFLRQAATFYSNWEGHDELSAHYTQAAAQFSIDASARDEILAKTAPIVRLPAAAAADPSIGALRNKITDLESDLEHQQRMTDELSQRNVVLERKIKGYEDKAIVDPQQMITFPKDLRRNLRVLFESFDNTVEQHYLKALVDPFHQQSQGARVPALLPRETATYSTFTTYETSNSQDLLLISNFELGCPTQAVIISSPSQTLLTSQPFEMQTTVSGGSEDYTVHVLATDLSMADFKNAVTVLRDASPHDFYHKHRVVSTGIRFFKTSLSDTESGQLDMHYSRDGASIDDSTNLRTLFGRPTSDTRRLYLAGHHEALRGQVGFVSQCSYRPHDLKSFDFRDGQHHRQDALFSDEITPVWVVDITNRTMHPIDDIPSTNAPCGIVIESLQQRHTFISRISNRSASMSLSIEFTQHFEGMPEQSKYGFAQRRSAPMKNYTSPLELIQRMPTQLIFSNYAMKRGQLLQAIYEDRVAGWWDDTLFPILKDMIAYGANAISGDTLEDWIDAALDATMTTLSAAAPMLAPGVLAARQVLEKPLKTGAESARKAVHDWAVGQPHTSEPYPYCRQGLLSFDVSAYDTNQHSAAATDNH